MSRARLIGHVPGLLQRRVGPPARWGVAPRGAPPVDGVQLHTPPSPPVQVQPPRRVDELVGQHPGGAHGSWYRRTRSAPGAVHQGWLASPPPPGRSGCWTPHARGSPHPGARRRRPPPPHPGRKGETPTPRVTRDTRRRLLRARSFRWFMVLSPCSEAETERGREARRRGENGLVSGGELSVAPDLRSQVIILPDRPPATRMEPSR